MLIGNAKQAISEEKSRPVTGVGSFTSAGTVSIAENVSTIAGVVGC